jgi:hypothetical protein
MERSVVYLRIYEPIVRSGKSTKSQDVLQVVKTTEDRDYVKR